MSDKDIPDTISIQRVDKELVQNAKEAIGVKGVSNKLIVEMALEMLTKNGLVG